MSVPTTMKALVITEDRKLAVKEVPVPKPFVEGHVLIKTKAVAANPTDWKHIDYGLGPVGSIVGCDASGEIVQMGSNEKEAEAISAKYGYKLGDFITGSLHGASVLHPENGAFAEYCLIDAGVSTKFAPANESGFTDDKKLGDIIPAGQKIDSFEKAASLPVSLYTSVMVFAMNFGKKVDFANKEWQDSESTLLIYGGATGFAQNFLQVNSLAKGFKNVVTIASSKHEELLKSYGVTENFDYKTENFLDLIASKYPNIKTIMDAVSSEGTYKDSYSIATKLADAESKVHVVNLMGFTIDKLQPEIKDDAKVIESSTLLYLCNGIPVPFGPFTFPASPEYRQTALDNIPKLEKIIAGGELKSISIKINEKEGFEGIIDAVDGIRTGKNKGEKFVVRF